MPPSSYRRLTGKRRSFLAFTQLFMGPDHLLLVRSSRFEERYQRFYFKDVQALVLTGLPRRSWLHAAMAVLAGLSLLIAATLLPSTAWRALLALLGLVPAAIGLADYFRGERCSMLLKTAVSNELLPPVSRMSTARLVISRLKPAIEQRQQLGEWTPEMQPFQGPTVLAPVPRHATPADRLVPAVFALLSFNALVYLLTKVTHQNEILSLMAYSVLAELVLAIAAMRRRGSDPRWILYGLCGVVIVCSVIDILSGVGVLGLLGWAVILQPRAVPRTGLSPSIQDALLWWGFGWRAIVSILAWSSWFGKAERPGDSL